MDSHNTKYKVLMMTGIYYGEINGPVSDFISMNCEIKLFHTPPAFARWSIYTRIKNRFGMDVGRYKRKRNEKISRQFYEACRAYRPDIVYVTGGKQLLPAYIKKIRKHSFIVAGFTDRIRFYPELYDTLKYYDVIYTFSPEDAAEICAKGGNGVCFCSHVNSMPYARKIPVNKDIDVCFIGNMYPRRDYGERYEMLRKLITDFPGLNFYIGGKCAPVRRPELFIPWIINRRERTCFVNKILTRSECNMIYNRSKICLVINRTDTGNTWTDRLVNIMATGAFQLVTHTDRVEKEYKGQLDTFKNYEELKEKIKYYLLHDTVRQEIARNGYRRYKELYHNREDENAAYDIIRKFEKARGKRPDV